jgi:hypothetical protein
LQGATKRFGLPEDTPARVFGLRDEIGVEGNRIADDQTLSPEQKGEALRKLASEGRRKLEGLLGADVSATYKANTGLEWIEQLESGIVHTYIDDNGSSRRRSVEVSSRQPEKQ